MWKEIQGFNYKFDVSTNELGTKLIENDCRSYDTLSKTAIIKKSINISFVAVRRDFLWILWTIEWFIWSSSLYVNSAHPPYIKSGGSGIWGDWDWLHERTFKVTEPLSNVVILQPMDWHRSTILRHPILASILCIKFG